MACRTLLIRQIVQIAVEEEFNPSPIGRRRHRCLVKRAVATGPAQILDCPSNRTATVRELVDDLTQGLHLAGTRKQKVPAATLRDT
jgi:hypothetical protein